MTLQIPTAIEGPFLKITEKQTYTLTPEQHDIFLGLKEHQESPQREYDNLKIISLLQTAQKKGVKISLAHFDSQKLNVKEVESVSVQAEFDEEGNATLTPYMGQKANNQDINERLGQLNKENATALRVNNEILLINPKKMDAVKEIISHRKLNKKEWKQFIETPSAFLDCSLVNLEQGFSARVQGATAFKHAYFGETEDSGINWFEESCKEKSIYPIAKIEAAIKNEQTLEEFKAQLEDSQKTGASELVFLEKAYDLSDSTAIDKTLQKLENKKNNNQLNIDEELEEEIEKDKKEINANAAESSPTILDIKLNDEELDTPADYFKRQIAETLYPESLLKWGNYLRKPFIHQLEGVRWILGLATNYIKASSPITGALLADDMGLGKTFMALSAIDHLYKIDEQNKKEKKPVLIVAPLSLLDNWKAEVNKTFKESPFKSIIILNSSADLNRFKIGKKETINQTTSPSNTSEDTLSGIRYSLKVGKHYGPNRLDLPERLVICTYETVRDYQFSLASIDWGMIVFDEAQNIKEPNALRTRACKALKADFKLVTTGTPVENSLKDFWCLIDTATPGYLESYQNFRDKYIKPILNSPNDEREDVKISTGQELRTKVGALMLRRLKEDNLTGLPKKQIFVGIENSTETFLPTLQSCMEEEQLKAYERTLHAAQEKEDAATSNHLKYLRLLKVISLHPRLEGEGAIPTTKGKIKQILTESYKMQSLINILSDIKGRNEKCIIFTETKHIQRFLSLALTKLFCLPWIIDIINGDTKAISKNKSNPSRIEIIKKFEEHKGFNIIIMSPVAAGVGLTVVGANNVIHFERHWNPAKEAQATDRVYRIGQKKDVNVYIPILHHPNLESFDVNLHKLLSQKTSLKDAVVTTENVKPSPEGLDNFEKDQRDQITAKHLEKMNWDRFEALCCELMSKELQADSAFLTPKQDFGADIIITNKDNGWLIQCKYTSQKKETRYKGIQEISGAKPKYEKEYSREFNNLLFMTPAKTISNEVEEMGKDFKVEILAFNDIAKLLNKHKVTKEDLTKRLNKRTMKIK